MIGMKWDTVAIALTAAKLQSFRSAVRRRILKKAGNAASKELLAAFRSAPGNENTRVLKRSYGSKVKAYASGSTVFVVTGPKSRQVQVTKYRDYRTGKMRTLVEPKTVNPAHYAHLAGKGRRNPALKVIRRRMAKRVAETIRDTLAAEVAKP